MVMGPKPRPVAERFWPKVDTHGHAECWLWTAGLSRGGYGLFKNEHQRTVYAHRWVYEQTVGPIPDGLEIDHICRNRACVNPEHLRVATRGQNCRNMAPLGGASRFKGVSRDRRDRPRPWQVFIQLGRRNRYLGVFADEVEAARAYDAAAVSLFGEFAVLNFPDDPRRPESGEFATVVDDLLDGERTLT